MNTKLLGNPGKLLVLPAHKDATSTLLARLPDRTTNAASVVALTVVVDLETEIIS